MLVRLQHEDGKLLSVSFLDDALNPNPDSIHAPIEHEEQEIIGEMAAKEKTLREAREKIDLDADDKDLQNLLNPPKKPAKPKDESSDDTDSSSEDSSSDDEDLDDEDDVGDV